MDDDMKLAIIQFCDVLTLRNLRLAHRSFRDLITTYQTTIVANARLLHFSEEDLHHFDVAHLSPSYPLEGLFLLDYRVRTARWMTHVLLEHHDEETADDFEGYAASHGNIAASEVQGDPVRRQVEAGFSVHWRLSDIARMVIFEAQSPLLTNLDQVSTIMKWITNLTLAATKAGHQLSSQNLSSMTRAPGSDRFLYELIETAIVASHYLYLESLQKYGIQSLGNYRLDNLLGTVFSNRVLDVPNQPGAEIMKCNDHQISAWLRWFICREGPGFFAKAWGSGEGKRECEAVIIREFFGRTEDQRATEKWSLQSRSEVLRHMGNTAHGMPEYHAITEWAPVGRQIIRSFPGVDIHLGRKVPKDPAEVRGSDQLL